TDAASTRRRVAHSFQRAVKARVGGADIMRRRVVAGLHRAARDSRDTLQKVIPLHRMHPRPDTRLRIGAFVVDPLLCEVSGAATTTKLEPRAMDVLVYLARRAGEVVSVDDLRAEVWTGVIVTPDSVYRAINAIRPAFRDDPRSLQSVATVPGGGYRLIAPVAPPGGSGNAAAAKAPGVPPAARPRTDPQASPGRRLWRIVPIAAAVLGAAALG